MSHPGTAAPIDAAPVPPARPSASWPTTLAKAAVAYVASRLCVLAGAAVVASQQVAEANRLGGPRPRNAVGLIAQVLTSWDGRWYYEIIRGGYPRSIPPAVTYEMVEARAAFFPVFPLLVRAVDAVAPGGDVLAALALNTVLGAAFVWLVGVIARDLWSEAVAYKAMLFAVFFPGSFVLSFAYSEAALLVLAAGCLLALMRRTWWLAGVLAAVGTATRPNGVALVAACAVAAFLAVRERREWSALVAPLVAPVGVVAFQLWLRHHTGEWAWWRVQREAWQEGTSFGITALRNTWEAFAHPLASPTDIITAVSVVSTVALLVALWKRRLPWPLTAYALVVVALMLLPATVTARPRFLYTAFPLFIAAAAWWPDEHEEAFGLTIAMSAAGLVALTGLYGVLGAIP